MSMCLVLLHRHLRFYLRSGSPIVWEFRVQTPKQQPLFLKDASRHTACNVASLSQGLTVPYELLELSYMKHCLYSTSAGGGSLE